MSLNINNSANEESSRAVEAESETSLTYVPRSFPALGFLLNTNWTALNSLKGYFYRAHVNHFFCAIYHVIAEKFVPFTIQNDLETPDYTPKQPAQVPAKEDGETDVSDAKEQTYHGCSEESVQQTNSFSEIVERVGAMRKEKQQQQQQQLDWLRDIFDTNEIVPTTPEQSRFFRDATNDWYHFNDKPAGSLSYLESTCPDFFDISIWK